MTSLRTRLTAPQAQARNAFRVSLVIGSALLLIFLAAIGFDLQQGNNVFSVGNAVIVIPGLAALASLILARRGRHELGIIILSVVATLDVLYTVTLVEGVGIVIGLALALVIIIVSQLCLPPRLVTRLTSVGIVGGLLTVLLDLFWTGQRFNSGIDNYLPFILAGLVLVLAYFIYQQIPTYNLQTKLLIGFLTVTVVSISAVTFVNDRLIRARLQDEAGANLKTLAQSRSQTVGDLLARETDILQAFALNAAIHDFAEKAGLANTLTQAEIVQLDRQWRSADVNNNNADPLVKSTLDNEVTPELAAFQDAFSENLQILVTDKRSVNIAATYRSTAYFHSAEGWWRTAFNGGAGQVYIGQPNFDAATGKLVTLIAVPIYAPETQEVVGIVAATYNLELLSNVLASTAPVGSGLLFPGGQLLQIGGEIVQLSPAGQASFENISGYTQFTYVGVLSLVSQAGVTSQDQEENEIISGLRWTFIVYRPTARALATVNAAAQATLLTGVGALVVAALAAFVISQFLTGPITRLTTVASKVTGGDLNAQARVEAGDEIGTLALTFNSMTGQLRQTLSGLEQRVAERTSELAQASDKMRYRATQLQTSAEVARTIASVLDLKELLPQVATLISERFGFYHVGIFLLDASGQYALLQAANSEGGQRMLARGHKLSVGQVGIVGYATGKGQPRIASDVGHDAVYFDNPDLPLTRSEMALPLKVRGRIIGALDVQSTKPAAFGEEDIALLTILADQIAIAIENARSFQQQATLAATNQQLLDEAQKAADQQTALAEENQRLLERAENAVQELSLLTRRLTGEAWEKFTSQAAAPLMAEDAAANMARTPARQSLARPIVLRGEVIGSLSLEDIDPNRQWSEHDIAILENVAERLALTLDNARLFEDAQQRLSELTIINSLTQTVATQQDLTALLKQAGDQILQTFGVRNGFIALYDKTSNQIELPYFHEGDQILQIPPVPLGRGLSSIVINSRRPLLINHDAERRATDLGAIVVGQLPRSFLGVPIVVGDEVVGVISVQSLTREGLFTEADVNLLTTIASNLGIGIQNARLFTETRRLAQRETRINTITRKLRSSQTVEAILETAAHELGRALNAPQVVVEIKATPVGRPAVGVAGNGPGSNGNGNGGSHA